MEKTTLVTIVIPARLQSTRLPQKPLALIGEHPLIWWTWQRAKRSKLANRVIIATDSEEILQVMSNYGAECVLTSENCASGSDRIFEVVAGMPDSEIVVNLQGDEPLMEESVLDGTIQILLNNSIAQIATAVCPFDNEADWLNPNQVKAVFNEAGRALYFSRAPLANGHLHIGLYVYRISALRKFCSLDPSPLEKAEKLEQLRAIENDITIFVYRSKELNREHFGVDTPEDLERARKILLRF